MLAPTLDAPETSKVVPLEIAAVVVNKVVETAAWNVVAPLIVNCAGLNEFPIVLVNVGVPETIIVLSCSRTINCSSNCFRSS